MAYILALYQEHDILADVVGMAADAG